MTTSYPNQNKKAVLGLSGGVDSTAAALLLKNQGYEVTGLFLDVNGSAESEAEKAEKAAYQLSIPFVYKNIKDEFAEKVISYFCDSYQCAKTPNPCIVCNPTVKFKNLQEEADRLGAYYLATGHYANVDFDTRSDRFFISVAHNRRKDQSYMLYRLTQPILKRLLLPLGGIDSKDNIRVLVREKGIHNADAKDSQEICFIRDMDYIGYLKDAGCLGEPGDFVDRCGTVLGQHQGISRYTIGQRKGLGMTFGKPTFVTGLDPKTNRVVLGEDQDLYETIVLAADCRFYAYEDGMGPLPGEYEGKKVLAKIRYGAKPAEAKLYVKKNLVMAVFTEPQRAATPGQSLVFYEGDRLLGGGFITREV